MSLLTIESAKAYVSNYFAGRANIHDARQVTIDGVPVVLVRGASEESGAFQFEVWEEDAPNGTPVLYGEY
jgi:hypothetical protein